MLRPCLSAVFAGALCAAAHAQNFPSRPIRVVVPFPAGGNVDTYIRQLARQMEISMGQPLVIDNRGGANGIVGCDIVAKAAPDGYTILATSIAFAVNPAMYKKLPYDSEKDFTPITNYAKGLGYVLAAHPSVPATNVKELIALAKKQPLRYGTAGIGNGQHLAGVLFSQKAGIEMLHVPYKGGGPVLTAVLGGEVHLNFPGASVAVPHVKSGKLRGLGFTGDKRISSLPDVPTIAESGLPGFNFDTGWHAMFAPPKTPAVIINRYHAEVRKAFESNAQLRENFSSTGYEPAADAPAAFEKLFRADLKKYNEIVRAAKIELQ
ncbi:MAG TPA: tripartite tricarboxylate transporter substrate binding protein [Burkholderiales bacterium]|nr:tripartite tricarboxylate transporter substrate binding protein [Burkholderiales bacterium]